MKSRAASKTQHIASCIALAFVLLMLALPASAQPRCPPDALTETTFQRILRQITEYGQTMQTTINRAFQAGAGGSAAFEQLNMATRIRATDYETATQQQIARQRTQAETLREAMTGRTCGQTRASGGIAAVSMFANQTINAITEVFRGCRTNGLRGCENGTFATGVGVMNYALRNYGGFGAARDNEGTIAAENRYANIRPYYAMFSEDVLSPEARDGAGGISPLTRAADAVGNIVGIQDTENPLRSINSPAEAMHLAAHNSNVARAQLATYLVALPVAMRAAIPQQAIQGDLALVVAYMRREKASLGFDQAQQPQSISKFQMLKFLTKQRYESSRFIESLAGMHETQLMKTYVAMRSAGLWLAHETQQLEMSIASGQGALLATAIDDENAQAPIGGQ